jgi:hypothetical protein
MIILSLIRPRDLTLDLQSASGTNEKLGQITATFTLMPKTNEDRQEVREFSSLVVVMVVMMVVYGDDRSDGGGDNGGDRSDGGGDNGDDRSDDGGVW